LNTKAVRKLEATMLSNRNIIDESKLQYWIDKVFKGATYNPEHLKQWIRNYPSTYFSECFETFNVAFTVGEKRFSLSTRDRKFICKIKSIYNKIRTKPKLSPTMFSNNLNNTKKGDIMNMNMEKEISLMSKDIVEAFDKYEAFSPIMFEGVICRVWGFFFNRLDIFSEENLKNNPELSFIRKVLFSLEYRYKTTKGFDSIPYEIRKLAESC
jgi:hypothetical protein